MKAHLRLLFGRLRSYTRNSVPSRYWPVFFVFLIIATLGFILPAQAQFTDIGNGLIWGFGKIMLIVADIAIQLTIFFLRFFIVLASYNNYIDVDVVQLGWIMVRDVSNMFFVVALLIIAFGTILGLEEYEWKKNLMKLIIAAILINFSNTICQLIIDMAHVFTITFLNAISATAGGNLIEMFKLDQINKLAADSSKAGEMDLASFAAALVGMMFALMSALAMGSYVVVMMARVVTLWTLIVLSPLAFILGVLPKTKSYAEKWWGEFAKHVIVAPVMVFFLWLSFATLGLGDIATKIQREESGPYNITNAENIFKNKMSISLNKVSTWENMANFFIAFAFLMLGIKTTEETGAYGSGAISGAKDFAKKVGTIASGYAAGRWLAGQAKEKGLAAGKWGLMNAPWVGGNSWVRGAKTVYEAARFGKANLDLSRNKRAKELELGSKKMADLDVKKKLGQISHADYVKEREGIEKEYGGSGKRFARSMWARFAVETSGRADKRVENWKDAATAKREEVEKEYSTSSSLGGRVKAQARTDLEFAEKQSKDKAERKMDMYRRAKYDEAQPAVDDLLEKEKKVKDLEKVLKDNPNKEGAQAELVQAKAEVKAATKRAGEFQAFQVLKTQQEAKQRAEEKKVSETRLGNAIDSTGGVKKIIEGRIKADLVVKAQDTEKKKMEETMMSKVIQEDFGDFAEKMEEIAKKEKRLQELVVQGVTEDNQREYDELLAEKDKFTISEADNKQYQALKAIFGEDITPEEMAVKIKELVNHSTDSKSNVDVATSIFERNDPEVLQTEITELEKISGIGDKGLEARIAALPAPLDIDGELEKLKQIRKPETPSLLEISRGDKLAIEQEQQKYEAAQENIKKLEEKKSLLELHKKQKELADKKNIMQKINDDNKSKQLEALKTAVGDENVDSAAGIFTSLKEKKAKSERLKELQAVLGDSKIDEVRELQGQVTSASDDLWHKMEESKNPVARRIAAEKAAHTEGEKVGVVEKAIEAAYFKSGHGKHELLEEAEIAARNAITTASIDGSKELANVRFYEHGMGHGDEHEGGEGHAEHGGKEGARQKKPKLKTGRELYQELLEAQQAALEGKAIVQNIQDETGKEIAKEIAELLQKALKADVKQGTKAATKALADFNPFVRAQKKSGRASSTKNIRSSFDTMTKDLVEGVYIEMEDQGTSTPTKAMVELAKRSVDSMSNMTGAAIGQSWTDTMANFALKQQEAKEKGGKVSDEVVLGMVGRTYAVSGQANIDDGFLNMAAQLNAHNRKKNDAVYKKTENYKKFEALKQMYVNDLGILNEEDGRIKQAVFGPEAAAVMQQVAISGGNIELVKINREISKKMDTEGLDYEGAVTSYFNKNGGKDAKNKFFETMQDRDDYYSDAASTFISQALTTKHLELGGHFVLDEKRKFFRLATASEANKEMLGQMNRTKTGKLDTQSHSFMELKSNEAVEGGKLIGAEVNEKKYAATVGTMQTKLEGKQEQERTRDHRLGLFDGEIKVMNAAGTHFEMAAGKVIERFGSAEDYLLKSLLPQLSGGIKAFALGVAHKSGQDLDDAEDLKVKIAISEIGVQGDDMESLIADIEEKIKSGTINLNNFDAKQKANFERMLSNAKKSAFPVAKSIREKKNRLTPEQIAKNEAERKKKTGE